MLTYKLLTQAETYSLWCNFGEIIGLENMRDNYGWFWPRTPTEEEIVYSCFDNGINVGWEAIRRDQIEPVMWAIGGVYPKYQGRGYTTKIFTDVIKKGFLLFPEVKWVFVQIATKNKRFVKFFERLVNENNYWKRIGELNETYHNVIFGLNKNKFMENQDVEKVSQSDIS